MVNHVVVTQVWVDTLGDMTPLKLFQILAVPVLVQCSRVDLSLFTSVETFQAQMGKSCCLLFNKKMVHCGEDKVPLKCNIALAQIKPLQVLLKIAT